MFSEGNIDIILKIITFVLWLIGVDDGVDVVISEVKKAIICCEVLLDGFRTRTWTVRVSGIVARFDSDAEELIIIGGELTRDFLLRPNGRTQPSTHTEQVESVIDIR